MKLSAAIPFAVAASLPQSPQSPESYCVKMDLSINGMEPILIEVTRSLAPLGSDRFHALVEDGFYNDIAIFRVVPDFVMQFGISGIQELNSKWEPPIPDDPVIGSNLFGYISYASAGPNTRNTQLFINFKDNFSLDARGFAPFAKVVKGMETALAVVNPTPGSYYGIDQDEYYAKGNKWITDNYPNITFITSTVIVECV